MFSPTRLLLTGKTSICVIFPVLSLIKFAFALVNNESNDETEKIPVDESANLGLPLNLLVIKLLPVKEYVKD